MKSRCAQTSAPRSGARFSWLLPVLVLAAPGLAAPGPSTPDRLLLINGTVHTADPRMPRAEAVLAEAGRIVYVGTREEARKRAGRDARTLDLRGLTVFPGFTDSHAHLQGIGERELSFELEGTTSLDDLKRRLREQHRKAPPGQWIVGRGWIESRWTPQAFPTKADLDEVVGDRPVVLERADGHAIVVSSRALALAHIDGSTSDPPGGKILKDAGGGPTGMLVDAAMDVVWGLVPEPTEQELLRQLETGAGRSVRRGWTQLQIAGNSFAEVDRLCRLYAERRIKLRLYDAIGGPGADLERLFAEGPVDRCGDRLTVRAIKLYIDGALGSRGAMLLAPYSDAPETSGLFRNEPESLLPILIVALKRGLQVETHAIGDRGNRTMLDLYEQAFATVPAAERKVAQPRWRIEHAQVLTAADIPRFAKLGVIASMQPSHAISDLFFAPSRLGPERIRYAYAWRALLDSGATVVAGSDAPVEKGDPIDEFYAAVVRKSRDGFADASWHREQRVTRDEALTMLTRAPAFAAFQENERGSIEAGKQADFTILSADLMSIPEDQIQSTQVVMTIIAGEVVYKR
ncbi:MAG TPA: amidohydrolase [Steroidobacteraceae bacterium]|nr:amidohydrolase [Steroidobacteraceae bacterium]